MVSDLIDSIVAVVGDRGVLTGADVSARPASWLKSDPCAARAIVRPADTGELAAVLGLCHRAGQPVVPIGGNTGLVEGAVAGPDDILLSLERMTAVESIDITGSTMTVQAGVPLQTVQERAAEVGLMFALDLGGRGTATIGGNIATNAGGNGVIRWGMMREQVLGLEAVLADGTVLSSMNRMLKNNAGYDLKQLFIGSEGTLGVVTRAVLRLRPALSSQNAAFAAVGNFDAIPTLLNTLGSTLGGALSAFEVMWADFFDTVVTRSGRHVAPVPAGYPYYVLIEARGGDQAKDEAGFERALEAAMEAGLIADAAFAQNARQREAMWAIRDDIDALVDSLDPAMAFDVSLPLANAEAYAAKVNERLAARWPDRFRGTTFGHLGDGNIHFLLTVGSADPAEQHEAMQIVYDELRPFDGSISAEHGIGIEKRPFLQHSRNDVEIDLMRQLKAALDPKNILNPGKVFG